jgi:hypothetical protein
MKQKEKTAAIRARGAGGPAGIGIGKDETFERDARLRRRPRRRLHLNKVADHFNWRFSTAFAIRRRVTAEPDRHAARASAPCSSLPFREAPLKEIERIGAQNPGVEIIEAIGCVDPLRLGCRALYSDAGACDEEAVHPSVLA